MSLGSRLWSRCLRNRTLAGSRREEQWGRCLLPSVPVRKEIKPQLDEKIRSRLHSTHKNLSATT